MKIKLLLFTIVLFSFGAMCSPEDTTQCVCAKVHYDYGVIGFQNGVAPIWGFTEIWREPATALDCASDTGQYVQTDLNSYYKIKCE